MRSSTCAIYLILTLLLLASCDYRKYPKGKRIYDSNCSFCHMENGLGLGKMYPNLHGSPYLTDKLSELPCIIRTGKKGQLLETVNMPPILIDETDMINLISYLNYEFGQRTPLDINSIKADILKCPD